MRSSAYVGEDGVGGHPPEMITCAIEAPVTDGAPVRPLRPTTGPIIAEVLP